MQTLGIIPARGCSKRLPGKNIKDFLGKPLIAWTIEAAKKSGAFERLIVVTDENKIAKIAKEYGAEVPELEPKELADDTAYVAGALRWMLGLLETQKYVPPHFILLEPSSIGRDPRQIAEVSTILEERADLDSLLSISEVPGHYSHLKQFNIGPNGIIGRVGDGVGLKNVTHRNQDVQKSYYANSAIYGFRRKNLFTGDKNLWGNSTYGYLMDDSTLADIDTQEEWDIAEFKMKHKRGEL